MKVFTCDDMYIDNQQERLQETYKTFRFISYLWVQLEYVFML